MKNVTVTKFLAAGILAAAVLSGCSNSSMPLPSGAEAPLAGVDSGSDAASLEGFAPFAVTVSISGGGNTRSMAGLDLGRAAAENSAPLRVFYLYYSPARPFF